MKIITADQRTPEWYAARLGRVTGSRVKDIVTLGAKGQYLAAREAYKREVVAERIYGIQGTNEVFVTEAMKWGMMNEQIARTKYQIMTGNKVAEEGFIQHDDLMAGVSTDGFIVDKNGNIEIKCLMPHNHLYNIIKAAAEIVESDEPLGKDLLPKDYKAQVQMQLWVTNRDFCDFIGYDSRAPLGLDLFYTRVERDEDYIMFIENEVIAFLQEVDREFNYFLQYLPVAERLCKACGSVFTDKITYCPDCFATGTEMKKIVQPPKLELNQKVSLK